MHALEEPLNVKFLELAKRCQVVLCCRATPLQKVSLEAPLKCSEFGEQKE